VKFVSRDDFVLTGSTDKVSECFRFVPLSVSSDIEQSGVEPCARWDCIHILGWSITSVIVPSI
jgi:hypothetical protein